ncbi:MAG: hypothetical protein FD123_2711 [Bacteroidetes bacterium]|nr:MAG: hypothetical protein FD123_2711 [Bacteroidota bacterium]
MFKQTVLLLFLIGSFSAVGQKINYAIWPLLRKVTDVDTNSIINKKNNVRLFIDSVYSGSYSVKEVEISYFNPDGTIFAKSEMQGHAPGVWSYSKYDIAPDSRVIRVSNFMVKGTDTSLLGIREVLQYDKQIRPISQRRWNKVKQPKHNPKTEKYNHIIWSYVNTEASKRFPASDCSEYLSHYTYDSVGYVCIEDQIDLLGNDTLAIHKYYRDYLTNIRKAVHSVILDSSTRAILIEDSLYEPIETKTIKNGELVEHTVYKHQYRAERLEKTSVYNALRKSGTPILTMVYRGDSLWITEPGKQTIKIETKDHSQGFIPPPPPPIMLLEPIAEFITTEKEKSGVIRKDYIKGKSKYDAPYKSIWYDDKGLVVGYKEHGYYVVRRNVCK